MSFKMIPQRGLAALCFLSLSLGAAPLWAQESPGAPVADTPIASAFPEASPTPPISVSAIPEGQMLTPPGTLPTAQGILPDDPNQVTLPAESNTGQESSEAVSGADIPPDPNVMDSAVNTPIYTRPLAEAPAPLDAPVDGNDDESSPYGPLAIMLWTCFLAAAAATSYFLYVRFGESRA